MKIKIFLTAIIALIFTGSIQANDEIMQAMRDEIKRSMDELQIKDLQKPYYIEYKVEVLNEHNVKSSLGATISKRSDDIATLTVGLRVGSYKLDNTNFFDVSFGFFGSTDDEERFKNRRIPANLDYNTLRREFWLATDAAYKQQSEIFSKKQSIIKNRMRKDTTHDFTKIDAKKIKSVNEFEKIDEAKYEILVNKLSALAKKYPNVQKSSVNFEFIPKTIYYVNSEGHEYIQTRTYTGLEFICVSQSKDGMSTAQTYSALVPNPSDLPSEDSLIKAIDFELAQLNKQVEANYLDDSYSGPIIFESQAAAQIFAQLFIPNLVAQREQLQAGNAMFKSESRYGAFQTKMGGRVLPEFLSIYDLPSEKSSYSTKLLGNFEYDWQGVKAEDLTLVKDGYLKMLLSDRTPIKRVRKSNGHHRSGAPMYSNIFIEASDDSKVLSREELKEKMMKLCKDRELEYGIIVRQALDLNLFATGIMKLTNASYTAVRGNGKMNLLEVYKVYPDGREELVRGANANGFSVATFKDIINVSDQRYVLNFLAPSVISSFMTGGDSYLGSSVVCPDILFEDGEIKALDEDFPKPPLLANPITN